MRPGSGGSERHQLVVQGLSHRDDPRAHRLDAVHPFGAQRRVVEDQVHDAASEGRRVGVHATDQQRDLRGHRCAGRGVLLDHGQVADTFVCFERGEGE